MKETSRLSKKTSKKNLQRISRMYSKEKGITLIALVITILFPYDEKLKYSNSNGFLLTTI